MDTPASTTKLKGVTTKMPIILTDISAILGLLMLIMSFAYLFIAVSVTKESTQKIRECSCTKDQKYGAVSDCLQGFRRGLSIITAPNQTIDPNEFEKKDTINRYCRNMNQEIGAGTCGILFGLFQTVVASVFLLAGMPDALKLIWIVVHAVIAFVCIVIVLLVFDVMLYKFSNRTGLAGTSVYFPDGFLHDGSPTSVRRGNTVVFVYLAFVFLDAVATVSGIGLMALRKPNGRVVNIVKPVSNEVFMMEPEPVVVVVTN